MSILWFIMMSICMGSICPSGIGLDGKIQVVCVSGGGEQCPRR